ncbi:MAG: molybdopterin-dependent oxidoreductase [Geminicoccaceae bacterium]
MNDLSPRPARPRWTTSVCPHDCPSTCTLEIEQRDGTHLGKVRGSTANPYTAGVICAKVARYAERYHHPARLGRPLLRRGPKGSGQFEAIGWDEALERVAEAFLDAERRFGSESVWPYYYAGTMGHVQRDGINRLRHVKRYSGMHATFCTTLAMAGWRAGHGDRRGADPLAMRAADLLVIWGGNPVSTHVHVMTHVQAARKARGARLVVVDPYRTGTAAAADLHLALKPGTDAALACALMHVLFRDGHADRAYMAAFADDPAALEAHLATRGPAWAAEITGLSVDEIEQFAALYGWTERAFIRCGYGFTRHLNGAVAMHAVTCLPVVGGKWRHRGGGALWGHGDIYHLDKTLIEGLDRRDPAVRVLDQSRIGPVLTGDPRDLGDGPPVKAMLIQNTNPLCVAPELGKVRAGFAREDLFTVVHEQFLTDTAAYADIVLPATMFLEHDDLYTASGHTRLQVARKLFAPFAESRSNHAVLAALAERLGAVHPGFAMSEWDLIEATLKASGHPDAATLAAPGGHDCLGPGDVYADGFGTSDKRFRFFADWPAQGQNHAVMPRLPDQFEPAVQADAGLPYRLVAAPARHYLNTTFTETQSSIAKEGRPTVKLAPQDAQALGVTDGDIVTLANSLGALRIHAAIADGQPPGTLVVESIWPNDAFLDGIGVNLLVSAEPGFPNGGGAFHGTRVTLALD